MTVWQFCGSLNAISSIIPTESERRPYGICQVGSPGSDCYSSVILFITILVLLTVLPCTRLLVRPVKEGAYAIRQILPDSGHDSDNLHGGQSRRDSRFGQRYFRKARRRRWPVYVFD